MKNEIIEKYLLNKHSTLLSYAVSLHKVYDINDEELWKSEEEFIKLVSDILLIYVNKYYLRAKKDLSTLNVNNLSDKDFKMTLALAVIADYFGTNYENTKNTYKKSIYSLTLVIYIVTNIDKEISYYNKKGVTIKSIVDKINELFGEFLKDFELQKNPFLLDILANKIKDAERKESRFFENLKNEESYLMFAKYGEGNYYVDYMHDIYELDNYEYFDVKNVYQKYDIKEKLMPIAYELASLSILKAYANNCNVPTLVLPMSRKFLNTKGCIDTINTIFSNQYVKNKIEFSINYTEYINNIDKFLVLKNLGYKLSLYIDEKEILVDYSKIKFDFNVYVSNKFISNNPKFLEFMDKSPGKYFVADTIHYLSEDEMIEDCLKEEN